MSLRDVEIKKEYRSLLDNVAKEFYIPLEIAAALFGAEYDRIETRHSPRRSKSMKNIFLKYIFVFATVLLVSFVMLTSIISTTMVNYSNMQTQEEVERIAETASKLISLE